MNLILPDGSCFDTGVGFGYVTNAGSGSLCEVKYQKVAGAVYYQINSYKQYTVMRALISVALSAGKSLLDMSQNPVVFDGITPNSGLPYTGGSLLTITGSGFRPGCSVIADWNGTDIGFGVNSPCAIVSQTLTQVQCILPGFSGNSPNAVHIFIVNPTGECNVSGTGVNQITIT